MSYEPHHLLTKSRKYALKHKWEEIDHQSNIMMISYRKGEDRINVYYSKIPVATVATIVYKPNLWRTQMVRRGVDGKTLESIFKNPRVHLRQFGSPGYHQDGKHISLIKKRQN